MISKLFKTNWFKIPKINNLSIKKVRFHPWKVIAFDGCNLMIKNQITNKFEKILITKFTGLFFSHSELCNLMSKNGFKYKDGAYENSVWTN